MRLSLKVFLAGLAVLLVAAHLLLWVFISSAGPQILQDIIFRDLGYSVSAQHVKFSLLSQGMKIRNLRLADPSRPGEEAFFTAKKVVLRLNLFALLVGRITVRKVIVIYPTLSVGRNQQGNWIVPERQRPDLSRKEPAGEGPAMATLKKRKSGFGSFLSVKFYKLALRKGEILFKDETISPPFWIRFKDINGKGQFATANVLRFQLEGQIESRSPGTFKIGGDVVIGGEKVRTDLQAVLQDLDITLLSPYYKIYAPVSIAEGKMTLESHIQSEGNELKDAIQTVTLRQLKLQSWDEKFLKGNLMGIPNRELAQYIERNSDQICLNFSLSGPLSEIGSLTIADTWKMLGLSMANQWVERNKTQ